MKLALIYLILFLFNTGLMNGKSTNRHQNDINRQLSIPLENYSVEVTAEDQKDIRTILLNSCKIASLTVLLSKAKIKKRSVESTREVGKRLFSYLGDKGLGQKHQYYIRTNKSNIRFV